MLTHIMCAVIFVRKKKERTSVATSDEEGDVSAEGEDGIMSPSPSIFFFFPSGEDTVR